MTLNQVIQRIKILAGAHRQVQTFNSTAGITDILNDKTVAYPACFLTDIPGSNIDVISKTVTFTFRLFLLDLVHVAASTKLNEQDVQSDMLNIAMDFLAQMDYSGYTDWKVAAAAPVVFVTDTENDRVAGVTVDVSVITPWDKNVCAVPANSFTFPIIDTTMKPVYDLVYTATGSEGSTLTIPQLKGNEILLLVRETFTQYEVTAFDGNQSTEFLWASSNEPLVNINLGLPAGPGERFLILYRKF
jgi:hypothetical protein